MLRLTRLPLVALTVAFLAAPAAARAATDPSSDVAIKAAFLYNFAKFTDWPELPATAPLTICVMGDARIAAALLETVRSQRISGHPIETIAMGGDGQAEPCGVLYVATKEIRRAAALLNTLKTLRILTVSDSQGFAQSTGVVEFFVENGHMRFFINTDAAGRSGLRLSSRLLGLATIVRDQHVQ